VLDHSQPRRRGGSGSGSGGGGDGSVAEEEGGGGLAEEGVARYGEAVGIEAALCPSDEAAFDPSTIAALADLTVESARHTRAMIIAKWRDACAKAEHQRATVLDERKRKLIFPVLLLVHGADGKLTYIDSLSLADPAESCNMRTRGRLLARMPVLGPLPACARAYLMMSLASELLVAFAEDRALGARRLEALFALWRRRSAELAAVSFDAGVARRWLDAIYKDWPLLFARELNRHSSSWPDFVQLRPLIDCVLKPDEWKDIAAVWRT
jgi:hypothetical protein